MIIRVNRITIKILTLIVILYVLLLTPDFEKEVNQVTDKSAFVWNSDQYWSELETRFVGARQFGCDSLSNAINSGLNEFDSLTELLQSENISPDAFLFHSIEQKIFDLSVLIGACPDSLVSFIESYGNLRTAIKIQSIKWDADDQIARDRIYRIIYGSRTAIEEIILQSSDIDLPDVFVENEEF